MRRKDELERRFPRLADLRGVGEYLHALAHRIDAGSGHGARALDLDDADTAGADGVDILQIAQRGDLDASQVRRFKNCGVFGGFDFNAVDF